MLMRDHHHSLSQEDENMENIEKFQEAFDCYDKNNNGRISTRVCKYIYFLFY